MRATLAILTLTAGIGLICCQNAVAFPSGATAMQEAAAPALQRVQYGVRHGRHGVVKCYREFIVGRYVCRHYRYW